MALWAIQLVVGYDVRNVLEELRSWLDDVPCTYCGETDHVSLRDELEAHSLAQSPLVMGLREEVALHG